MPRAFTTRRAAILCLALALSAYCYAQNLTIGNALPCGTDNLSCVPGEECYNRVELCNGNDFCSPFGEDEGDPVILNALDCVGAFGPPMRYRCNAGLAELTLDLLCDGNADCVPGGDDETNALCANKCRLPFYGGCSFTRQCASSALSVNCGACLVGFVETGAVDCLASVSFTLDASVYNTSEGVPTVQVCVLGSVATGNLDDIAGQSFDLNLALSDGTALGGGVDWAWTSTPAIVTLDFDSTNLNVPQCLDIDINDDMIVEPTEDFNVDLSIETDNPFGQITLGTSSATVFIADNDGKPTIYMGRQ